MRYNRRKSTGDPGRAPGVRTVLYMLMVMVMVMFMLTVSNARHSPYAYTVLFMLLLTI